MTTTNDSPFNRDAAIADLTGALGALLPSDLAHALAELSVAGIEHAAKIEGAAPDDAVEMADQVFDSLDPEVRRTLIQHDPATRARLRQTMRVALDPSIAEAIADGEMEEPEIRVTATMMSAAYAGEEPTRHDHAISALAQAVFAQVEDHMKRGVTITPALAQELADQVLIGLNPALREELFRAQPQMRECVIRMFAG